MQRETLKLIVDVVAEHGDCRVELRDGEIEELEELGYEVEVRGSVRFSGMRKCVVKKSAPSCNRAIARQHGDPRYAKEMPCACGECASIEAADDFLDALAHERHSQEDQQHWEQIVRCAGYALPQSIWKHVEAWIRDSWQAEAEQAERAAGWDPNP